MPERWSPTTAITAHHCGQHAVDVLPFLNHASDTVWAVESDPDEPTDRYFLPARLNLAPERGGLKFKIDRTTGRVAWSAHLRTVPSRGARFPSHRQIQVGYFGHMPAHGWPCKLLDLLYCGAHGDSKSDSRRFQHNRPNGRIEPVQSDNPVYQPLQVGRTLSGYDDDAMRRRSTLFATCATGPTRIWFA